MPRFLFISLALVCLCPAMRTAHARSAADTHRIAPVHVVDAVLAAHPDLAGTVIELPAPVNASTAAPVLSAGPLERWSASSSTARVRLQCQGQGVCLPFYAIVHLSPTAAALAGGSPRASEKPNQTSPSPSPAIHTGQRASLLIDSGLLHLRVPVTCLQAGAIGSTIRVAGPGRRMIYEAAVLDGATLRGKL